MKYYVYSFLWKQKDGTHHYGTDLYASKTGIIGLYEHTKGRSEPYCITHVQEITKEEYELSKKNSVGVDS